jgi:hypothetical protein
MNNRQPNKLASCASTSPPTNQNLQQNKTSPPPRPRQQFSYFFVFFGTFTPPKKGGGGVGRGRAARQGKRDQYSQEKKYVSNLPICCILNR